MKPLHVAKHIYYWKFKFQIRAILEVVQILKNPSAFLSPPLLLLLLLLLLHLFVTLIICLQTLISW